MKLELKGKEYDIPENINQIKLKHFKGISLLDFANVNPMQYTLEIASILMEEPIDFFRSLTMEEIKPIINILDGYKENTLTQDISDIIEINNEKYIKIDLNKLTVGEWIDTNDIMQKGALNNLEQMIAILYRKENEGYNAELLKERSTIFLELPIGKVYGAIGFFQNTNKL